MIRDPGAARRCALLLGLALPATAGAACLELASHPDGAVVARVAIARTAPAFAITYMHSVTRTPVEERFAIDGTTLVQTQMMFAMHGPGLPTAADPGGTMAVVDGRHVVTMARRFDAFVMRLHGDQEPQLHAAGNTRSLAAWGNRALSLRAVAGTCTEH